MNITLTGGGSGGHIKPVLAVAHEIKRQDAGVMLTYIGQHDDDLIDVVKQDDAIDIVETVWAGKLRRYSGLGWQQLLDVRTQALNARDIFRTIRGIGQVYAIFGRDKPEVVFTRGGFVSVPVALAARLHDVPYITHDADSIPSLANRLIARWAALHIVALPADNYSYPAHKVRQIGMPAGREFIPVSSEIQRRYRQEIGLSEYKQIVLITGGGNGAQALNEAVIDNARYLLARYKDLAILHFAGRALEDETNAAYDALSLGSARRRVRVYSFASDFYRYTGAADVIVARGGMSSLAEFALQHKAVILVPSPQLPWNVANSQALSKRGAVAELLQVHAEQPERLGRLVGELLDDAAARERLGLALSALSQPTAARDIATVVLKLGAEKHTNDNKGLV